MKKVLVVCPKLTNNQNKSLDTLRVYSNIIGEFISVFKDNGFEFEAFAEDEFFNEFVVKYVSDSVVRRVTSYRQSDLDYARRAIDCESIPDCAYEYFECSDKLTHREEESFSVPLTLLKSDKEAYYAQRNKMLKKRHDSIHDDYLSNSGCVLQFRTNNKNDRGVPIKNTVSEGDGRLCIEVDLNEGYSAVYYGGVYLTKDVLPTILSSMR